MNLPKTTRKGIIDPKNIIIKDGVAGLAISEKEGQFLRKRVEKIHNGNILQIGTFHGLSLSYFQDVCVQNNNKIWSIDIDFYQEFQDNIVRWQIENIITVITGDSTKVHTQFENGFFDFIFIDANHAYDFTKADIENYWPKLKINGLMTGHDYCKSWPGVVKSVNERFKIQHPVEKIWRARKIGEFPQGSFAAVYSNYFSRPVTVYDYYCNGNEFKKLDDKTYELIIESEGWHNKREIWNVFNETIYIEHWSNASLKGPTHYGVLL